MEISQSKQEAAHVQAVQSALDALAQRGVWTAGNAFSPIVLVKGQLNDQERAGGELLGGADGDALRSALLAMGYEPQDYCALAAVVSPQAALGTQAGPLSDDIFREALETLDPEAIVLLDSIALDVMREAYAESLAAIEDFETALLTPGLVARVCGRRVLALDGFESALSNAEDKRRMWVYLKQLHPEEKPY